MPLTVKKEPVEYSSLAYPKHKSYVLFVHTFQIFVTKITAIIVAKISFQCILIMYYYGGIPPQPMITGLQPIPPPHFYLAVSFIELSQKKMCLSIFVKKPTHPYEPRENIIF